MKKTLSPLLLFLLLSIMLSPAAMAQSSYRHGYSPRPSRVQTIERHGHEYIAWHRYYVGLRLGFNVAHVSSDSPLLDGSNPKAGLNIGLVTGMQLTPYTPLFFETGLFYTQRGGKSGSGSDKFTYDLNYLELPLLIKYKHFLGNGMNLQPYAGGYVALGTDGKIKDYQGRQAFSSYEDGYFNRFDGGLKIGCGMGFNMLYVDACYQLGLANIGQDDFDDTHNGCFTINVGVNF